MDDPLATLGAKKATEADLKFDFDPLSDFLILDKDEGPSSTLRDAPTTKTTSSPLSSLDDDPLSSSPPSSRGSSNSIFDGSNAEASTLDFFAEKEKKPTSGSAQGSNNKDIFGLDDEDDGGSSFLSQVQQNNSKKTISSSRAYLDSQEREQEELDTPYAEPPRPTFQLMYEEYPFLFPMKEGETEIDLPNLRLRAQHGDVSNTVLRGVCWKLFLGTLTSLDPTKWANDMQKCRDNYNSLAEKYLSDPHKDKAELDLAINNPLSQDNDSPWQQYFLDTELKKQIRLDLIRLFPEREFFKNEAIRELLLRMLFVFAKENPNILYKQGMHELLAPLLYILSRESVDATAVVGEGATDKQKRAADILKVVSDSAYIEHDSYDMFCRLMQITGKWFVSPQQPRPSGPAKMDSNAEPFAKVEPQFDNAATSPIVQKCKRIQQELVRRADPELFNYLQSVHMEPQLYALRWVRLLLGREFQLEDLFIIWDAMFAYGHDLVLVDYLIVSMLVYIRNQLIGKEHYECLNRLFKYPPIEDVKALIEQAFRFIKPTVTHTSISKEKPPASTTEQDNPLQNSASPVASPTVQHTTQPPATTVTTTTTTVTTKQPAAKQAPVSEKKKKNSFFTSFNNIIKEASSSSSAQEAKTSVQDKQIQQGLEKKVSTLQQRIESMEQRQAHTSLRLERIIFTLQSNLLAEGDSAETKEEKRDSIMLALAEMKQVKDILAGLIPEEELTAPSSPITTVTPSANLSSSS